MSSNLTTKDGKSYRLVSVYAIPKLTGGHETYLLCYDKQHQPVEINIKDVVVLGK